MNERLEKILSLLRGVKKSKRGWVTHCPGHDGQRRPGPSAQGPRGRRAQGARDRRPGQGAAHGATLPGSRRAGAEGGRAPLNPTADPGWGARPGGRAVHPEGPEGATMSAWCGRDSRGRAGLLTALHSRDTVWLPFPPDRSEFSDCCFGRHRNGLHAPPVHCFTQLLAGEVRPHSGKILSSGKVTDG